MSPNFSAICEETNDVYYFGEDADIFSGGELINHSGEWRAGVNYANAGLIMPGKPTVGYRYFLDIVQPEIAIDRVEVISLDSKLAIPAGSFANCLRIQEGTALNPAEREYKTYTPDISLIQDQYLLITS